MWKLRESWAGGWISTGRRATAVDRSVIEELQTFYGIALENDDIENSAVGKLRPSETANIFHFVDIINRLGEYEKFD